MLNFLDGSPIPPPPDLPSSSKLEACFFFMLAYLLLVSCVLFVLPSRWTTWAWPRRGEK